VTLRMPMTVGMASSYGKNLSIPQVPANHAAYLKPVG
jgi:hypothetical protein